MKTDVSITIQGNADPKAVHDAAYRAVMEGQEIMRICCRMRPVDIVKVVVKWQVSIL